VHQISASFVFDDQMRDNESFQYRLRSSIIDASQACRYGCADS
jgi:hypothetical protein